MKIGQSKELNVFDEKSMNSIALLMAKNKYADLIEIESKFFKELEFIPKFSLVSIFEVINSTIRNKVVEQFPGSEVDVEAVDVDKVIEEVNLLSFVDEKNAKIIVHRGVFQGSCRLSS